MAIFDPSMLSQGGNSGWLGPSLGQGGGFPDQGGGIVDWLKQLMQTQGAPQEPSGVKMPGDLNGPYGAPSPFPTNGTTSIPFMNMLPGQSPSMGQSLPMPAQQAPSLTPQPNFEAGATPVPFMQQQQSAPPAGAAGNGIDPNGYQYGPGGPQAWQQAGAGAAALPRNAAPVQYQAPAQQPQAPQQQPDFMQRLSAASHNLAAGPGLLPALFDAAQGMSTGQRLDPQGMAQQQMAMRAKALQEVLMSRGMPADQARSLSMATATDPKLAETLLPQALNLGPPKTTDYSNPQTGMKGTAVFDPASNGYKDLITGRPLNQSQMQVSGNSNSPFTASPIPANVDPAKFRQDEAARIADAEKELRTRGEGAIAFLPDAIRTMENIKAGKYDNAIGPIQGADWYNDYVRAAGNSTNVGGAHDNLGAYNELKASINRLSSSNLKAQFGSRISNNEINLNKQTFGSAQSAGPETAHSILSERVRANLETVARNVESGFIAPSSVPPEVVQKGVEMGVFNPKTFGVSAASQQSSGGWVPIGNGVRIREKR